MSQSAFYRGLEAAQHALARSPRVPDAEAQAVHEVTAPLLAQAAAAARVACRSGCAACCHLPVGLQLGEALRLAAACRHDPDLVERIATAAAATAALPWSALAGQPCPLLREGACAAYAARPLACRSLTSSDAAACARGVAGTGDVPIDDVAFWLGQGAAAALEAAQPLGPRELRSALHELLQSPAGETEAAAAFARARATHDARPDGPTPAPL
ncbi:MAG: YkgJ family cysteine cluster protein [Planctomycetes bacterium]|nr:YkgJ family cysteine cluster protein [Planctomycetota bacterium]